MANGWSTPRVTDSDGTATVTLGLTRVLRSPPTTTATVRRSSRWSSQEAIGTTQTGQLQVGEDGDIPVPHDYDGDGAADIAVFRPSSGMWFVAGQVEVGFGQLGDVPVPADYDGDGRVDIAVYRPSTSTWVRAGPVQGDARIARRCPGASGYRWRRPRRDRNVSATDGSWSLFNLSTGATNKVVYGQADDVPIAGVSLPLNEATPPAQPKSENVTGPSGGANPRGAVPTSHVAAVALMSEERFDRPVGLRDKCESGEPGKEGKRSSFLLVPFM